MCLITPVIQGPISFRRSACILSGPRFVLLFIIFYPFLTSSSVTCLNLNLQIFALSSVLSCPVECSTYIPPGAMLPGGGYKLVLGLQELRLHSTQFNKIVCLYTHFYAWLKAAPRPSPEDHAFICLLVRQMMVAKYQIQYE